MDWPRICRIKLTLEIHPELRRYQNKCQVLLSKIIYSTIFRESLQCANETICNWAGAPTFTINGQFPPPKIQVCQEDLVLINVVNKVPGHNILLHWHGTSYFLDEISISSFSTFQYKFEASEVRTNLYYTFSGFEEDSGISGTLIVGKKLKFQI